MSLLSFFTQPATPKMAQTAKKPQPEPEKWITEEKYTPASSCVQWYRYEEKRHELSVSFNSRVSLVYTYKGVSLSTFQEFKRASSKGRFVNFSIKPNHSFTRRSR